MLLEMANNGDMSQVCFSHFLNSMKFSPTANKPVSPVSIISQLPSILVIKAFLNAAQFQIIFTICEQ